MRLLHTRYREDLFSWIATWGKVARHIWLRLIREAQAATDQGDLKTGLVLYVYALHDCILTLHQQHHTSPSWAPYSVCLCWLSPASVL